MRNALMLFRRLSIVQVASAKNKCVGEVFGSGPGPIGYRTLKVGKKIYDPGIAGEDLRQKTGSGFASGKGIFSE
jgi:hypothetical protein